jgi:dTDP-glucose 4,6-dehydratase
MTIFVTGGCGFIGTNFVLKWLSDFDEKIVNVDKLTYAANVATAEISHPQYNFVQIDITKKQEISALLALEKPRAIFHFAAESHVDRSIASPEDFVTTNINGTHSLLRASLDYYLTLNQRQRNQFRFVNVSTDEVYGALGSDGPSFTEQTPLAPNSPYSASKASADMLARSYFRTFDLPVITTRCSNNYGPYQNKEKLIPTAVHAILNNLPIPLYGNGKQIRDWLFVNDHIEALIRVSQAGEPGSTFNIGGGLELENISLVSMVCEITAKKTGRNLTDVISLIQFVDDRPAHDFRYSINSDFIREKLGWAPQYDLNSALDKTIDYYL